MWYMGIFMIQYIHTKSSFDLYALASLKSGFRKFRVDFYL